MIKQRNNSHSSEYKRSFFLCAIFLVSVSGISVGAQEGTEKDVYTQEPDTQESAHEQPETQTGAGASMSDSERESESESTGESSGDNTEESGVAENTEEVVAQEGISTVHLPDPQGNWLFKRLWWQQALERIQKIREYVDAILDARPEFFVRRADIDKTILAPFFMTIGFDQGELKKHVDELLDFIEHQRQRSDLAEQERVQLQKYQSAEQDLKRIKSDIEMIATILDRMNDDMNVLFGQIRQAREYDQKAWEHFKKIADVVSDTQARTLYYEMGGLKNRIVNIQTYIQHEFTKHFNDLVAKLSEKVESIQEVLEVLKNNDFDLREQREMLYQKVAPCPVAIEEQEVIEVEPEHGFFHTYFVNPVSSVISYIGSGIYALYTSIVGGTEQHEPDVEPVQD